MWVMIERFLYIELWHPIQINQNDFCVPETLFSLYLLFLCMIGAKIPLD